MQSKLGQRSDQEVRSQKPAASDFLGWVLARA
jgi:hypothetical protein